MRLISIMGESAVKCPGGGSLSVEISDICQIEIRSDIRSARQHALDARMEQVQRDSGAIWLRNPRQHASEPI